MSSDNTFFPKEIWLLLISEGWIEDSSLVSSEGIILFTHPHHAGRQLSLPIDTQRHTDWLDLCESTIGKMADLTGRTTDEIHTLIEPASAVLGSENFK